MIYLNSIKTMFFSRMVVGVQLVHILIFGFGLFQRGGIVNLFKHVTYESVGIIIIMTIDLPTFYFLDWINTLTPIYSSEWPILPGFIVVSFLQWLLIGISLQSLFLFCNTLRGTSPKN